MCSIHLSEAWEKGRGRERDQPAKTLSVRIAWALFSFLNDAKHPGSQFTPVSWGYTTHFPQGWGVLVCCFPIEHIGFEPASLSDHFSLVSCTLPISPQKPFPLFLYQKWKREALEGFSKTSLDFVDL